MYGFAGQDHFDEEDRGKVTDFYIIAAGFPLTRGNFYFN
jgi:hypothetical protein